MKPTINIHNQDCIEAMAKMEDNAFDLAIVDPEYGSDNIQGGYTKGIGGRGSASQKNYNKSLWGNCSPTNEYFKRLKRISLNQIVWGANHFGYMPGSSAWIVWDKKNQNTSYADCELAWSSFNKAVRKFEFRWNGMLQEDMKNKEKRIHPTQKPVALYKWLLKNYASEGNKILDTHMGSGSIAIACHDMGFDLEAYEIDQEYHQAALQRLNTHRSQLQMF